MERLRERLDAFALERRGDVVEVDAGVGEVRDRRARVVDAFERPCRRAGRRRRAASASTDACASVFTVSRPISVST